MHTEHVSALPQGDREQVQEGSDTATPELWVVCPATFGRFTEAEDLAEDLGVDPGHVILATGGDADGYEFEGIHLVFRDTPRESVLVNEALNIIHRHMRERGCSLWDVLVIDPKWRLDRPQIDTFRDTMRSLDTWQADPDDGTELDERAHQRFDDVDDPTPHGPHIMMLCGETGQRFDGHIIDNDVAWQDFRRRNRICGGSALVNLES